jgi:hypothetical protein
MMNFKFKLDEIDLTPDNSVVIGSGILSALGVRESNDIDLVVTAEVYGPLRQSQSFKIEESHGREILTDGLLEIGTEWGVLGKDQTFDDLRKSSVVIDGVRYITPQFLLSVKKSWLNEPNVRQKDADDIGLIESYLAKHPHEFAV